MEIFFLFAESFVYLIVTVSKSGLQVAAYFTVQVLFKCKKVPKTIKTILSTRYNEINFHKLWNALSKRLNPYTSVGILVIKWCRDFCQISIIYSVFYYSKLKISRILGMYTLWNQCINYFKIPIWFYNWITWNLDIENIWK